MELQKRLGTDSDNVSVQLNHIGCPSINPVIDVVWPKLEPIESKSYEWQDTYTCSKCDVKIVVSLVKEKTL